jgi:hypothetical protein
VFDVTDVAHPADERALAPSFVGQVRADRPQPRVKLISDVTASATRTPAQEDDEDLHGLFTCSRALVAQ